MAYNSFSWKKVFALTNKKWPLLLIIFMTVLFNAAINPISPLIIKEIIDNGFSGKSSYSFTTLVLILMGVGLVEVIIIGIQSISISSLSSTITLNVRERLHSKIQEQSMNFFTETKMGEVIARMTEEANSIGDTAIKPFIYTFQTVLSLGATIVVMFSLNWQLTSIILLATPLLFIPIPFIGRIAYKLSKRLVKSITELNNYINRNLNINGVLLNRIFGRKKLLHNEFNSQIQEVKKLTMKQSYVSIGYDSFFMLATTLAPLLVFWFGRPGSFLEISAGTAIAFTGYIASIFNPIQQLGQLSITLQQSKYVFERFFEYINLPCDETNKGTNKNMTSGSISIRDVSFSYSSGVNVLKNISLEVGAKEKIGIVGPSGSGKTTLGYLLTRIQTLQKGEILIDGVDINEFDIDYFHKNVGMIVQEPYILNASIKENLKIANENTSDDEIIESAQSAFIHDKIMSLPDGYDTIVGERGYKLSGGEKQRLSIARVFLQDPKIIILDEATSALDTRLEYEVQKVLNKLTSDRTIITIAHRVATIKDCDIIYVLKNGEIVESGNYRLLMGDTQSEFHQIYA